MGLLLWGLIVGGWLSSELAAQNPGKAPQKEEEGPAKANKQTGKKPSKEEEEEPTKPKPRPPIRVGDEELEVKQQPSSAKPAGSQALDLEREAREAKHDAVKQLFKDLAKPHDLVNMPSGSILVVKPIRPYVGSPANFKGSLALQPFEEKRELVPVSRRDITGVDHYEHLAVRKVTDFLKAGYDREPPGSKKFLSQMDLLRSAEKALEWVAVWHESARERGHRQGDGWDELKASLDGKLLAVRLQQLRALSDRSDWDAAFELATRLKEKYPKQKELLVEIARLSVQHAERALRTQDFETARKRLMALEEELPSAPEMEAIRERLRKKAAEIVEEARKLEKEDPKKAIAQLQTAESIYPQLPGLHDFYLQLSNKYPVLYVRVRDLPENLSPARAYTDSEKQGVELLFESLIKFKLDPQAGQRYEPGLAAELPRPVPLGRQFQLVRNASWSDGRQVTAADVRHTVQLLSDAQWPGRIPEWADLMQEGARIEGDALQISLIVRQGYLDPLALMNFKVLPESLDRADNEEFARQPIGSGPYRYQGRDGDFAVFVANPYYAGRPGKAGLPRIREIRFYRSDEDPAKEVQQGRLHLFPDLPSAECKRLQGLRDVTVQTAPNRRIYFLALNHRRAPLQDLHLRRAVAYAVDRERILNTCFREGVLKWHRPLAGPYPPGSWACKPGLALPVSPKLAKAQAELAKAERVLLDKLTLKYPEGDAAAAKACAQIRDALKALNAGIELELIARPPRQLRRDVEDLHDYDLAYYHWDYPSEAYWLWPLFDPQATGPGGGNFLGYENDSELQSLFRRAMTHRELSAVQSLTYEIQDRLYEQMPLVPLWQLDTHLAVHGNLRIQDRTGKLIAPDPLSVFSDVEWWSLRKD
jgi:peptide/nickel transport system substrate-binding protein